MNKLRSRFKRMGLIAGVALTAAANAWAQDVTAAAVPAAAAAVAAAPAAVVNSGDTAWVLVSTALVLLMTIPGLALSYGNPALLWIQFTAVMVTLVYSGVMSYVLLKIVDAVLGLRASEQAERIGLDLTDHRETGYTVLD